VIQSCNVALPSASVTPSLLCYAHPNPYQRQWASCSIQRVPSYVLTVHLLYLRQPEHWQSGSLAHGTADAAAPTQGLGTQLRDGSANPYRLPRPLFPAVGQWLSALASYQPHPDDHLRSRKVTSSHFPVANLDVLRSARSLRSPFAVRFLVVLQLFVSIKARFSFLYLRRTGHVHVTFTQAKIALAVNRIFPSHNLLSSGWRNNIPHSCSSIRESLAWDPQHYLP
jgi:hypothetical protein